MAESVDALVSNTSRFTPVPVRPRLWVHEERNESYSLFLLLIVGDSRPMVVECVAVWRPTSKLAKPHRNTHRLRPNALANLCLTQVSVQTLKGGCADMIVIYCSTLWVCAIFFSGIRASLRLKSRCTSTLGSGYTKRGTRVTLFFLLLIVGDNRPMVVECVAVWLPTSKLAKPHSLACRRQPEKRIPPKKGLVLNSSSRGAKGSTKYRSYKSVGRII